MASPMRVRAAWMLASVTYSNGSSPWFNSRRQRQVTLSSKIRLKSHQPRLRVVACVLLEMQNLLVRLQFPRANGAHNSNGGNGVEELHVSICSKSKLQRSASSNQCGVPGIRRLYQSQAPNREHGNIVFLSELFGRFCYVKSCLVAQVVYAIKSKKLP